MELLKAKAHLLNRQWQLFLLALAFFTRIPIPDSVPYSEARLNRANRYFGLVGGVVGGIAGLVFTLAAGLFSDEIAILVAMIATLVLTGAFHEDGLADTADGLGGGITQDDKLRIMKDSRIGTYGAVALCMALLLKFVNLTEVDNVALALVLGHCLSRVVAASLLSALSYVSEAQTSKSKPLAHQQNGWDLILLWATGGLVLALLPLIQALALLLLVLALRTWLKHWLARQLGGFTGDTLGASQQITELVIYLFLCLPLEGLSQ